jgi:hypothetical protein
MEDRNRQPTTFEETKDPTSDPARRGLRGHTEEEYRMLWENAKNGAFTFKGNSSTKKKKGREDEGRFGSSKWGTLLMTLP